MAAPIVVAGATGKLGSRIVKALIERGATVIALVRTDRDDAAALRQLGARVAIVDLGAGAELAAAVAGAACVVSAIQGLHEVIVDAQARLLAAAIAAGVPRFIPSDFSTDFTVLPAGENRNFDLRREFHVTLDQAPIASTSIFNGAFGEILTYGMPLLDFNQHSVGFWEDADWRMDFTTMDDTAAFTAAAALDPTAPRALRIASFQVTPRELLSTASEVTGTPFALVRLGSFDELRAYNQRERAAHPEGEREIFPRWQQSQYVQSMFATQHASLDNDRYPGLTWSTLPELLATRRTR